MRAADLVRLASETLVRHPLRSALTLAAVAIGVLSVLALASLGSAAGRYVREQFAGAGAHLITVSPGRTESSGLGSNAGMVGQRPLTLDDAEAVRRRVPRASAVVPLSLGTAPVEFGTRRRDVYLVGATGSFARMRELPLQSGRFLPGGDAPGREAVVVLGATLAHELFERANPVGAVVRVARARYRVIGVLAEKGSSLGADFDDMAIVPVVSGMSLLGQSNLHHVLVQAPNAAAVAEVREAARAVLMERHGEEDFSMITQDALLATFRSVLDAVTLGLACIAGISLAVAGVGIMNVMLVSVAERTAEIGLLKALGGGPGEVRALFLAEAAGLSLTGAVLGVALEAVALVFARARWPSFPLAFEPGWTLGVVLFALGTGVLFAALPARRAAALAPAAALARRA